VRRKGEGEKGDTTKKTRSRRSGEERFHEERGRTSRENELNFFHWKLFTGECCTSEKQRKHRGQRDSSFQTATSNFLGDAKFWCDSHKHVRSEKYLSERQKNMGRVPRFCAAEKFSF
jgi:hypothetical protein